MSALRAGAAVLGLASGLLSSRVAAQTTSDENPARGDAYGVHLGVHNEADLVAALFEVGVVSNESTRFRGLFSLGVVSNASEDFVGALQLSFVRNESNRFTGVTQLALYDNYADEFRGVAQLSLWQNRAGEVYGIGQVSPAYNEAWRVVGVGQLGVVNRTASLIGLGQFGIYNRAGLVDPGTARAGERLYVGLAQVGAYNRTKRTFVTALELGGVNVNGTGFIGLAQVGLWNETKKEPFYGAVQLGAANAAHGFRGLAQVGGVNTVGPALAALFDGKGETGNFIGGVQASSFNYVSGDFLGLAEVSVLGNYVKGRSRALVQASLGMNITRSFGGLAQAGVMNLVRGSFVGLAQIGGYNSADDAIGIQIGLVNRTHASRRHSYAVASNAVMDSFPRSSYAYDDGYGYGGAGERGRALPGQIGIVNFAGAVRGFQIGIYNETDDLGGVQIGLVNVSKHNGLPVSVLLNAGL